MAMLCPRVPWPAKKLHDFDTRVQVQSAAASAGKSRGRDWDGMTNNKQKKAAPFEKQKNLVKLQLGLSD